MNQINITATQTTFRELNFGDKFIFLDRPVNEITGPDILFVQRINYKVDDNYYHALGSSIAYDLPFKDIDVLKIT